MDKLINVLKEKNISDKLRKMIISMYLSAVNFWGIEREELILDAIKEFEFVFIADLADKIVKAQSGITRDNGVGENSIGLCMVSPIIENGKIIDVKRYILLESNMSDDEIISILVHELFFHGVKSMIQPFISENILMMGLEASKYCFDKNNNLSEIKGNFGYGLEELSTYYGQNIIMKDVYNREIDIDLLLFDVANSLGKILMETNLGKLILDAQITKDLSALEDWFMKVEDNRVFLSGDSKRITWEYYNKLMDNFIKLSSNIYIINDASRFEVELTKYQKLYVELINLNFQILCSSIMLDYKESVNSKVRK